MNYRFPEQDQTAEIKRALRQAADNLARAYGFDITALRSTLEAHRAFNHKLLALGYAVIEHLPADVAEKFTTGTEIAFDILEEKVAEAESLWQQQVAEKSV